MNPRRMKRTGKHRMMRRLRLSGGCLHLNRNQSRRRSAVHQPKTSFRTFQFDLLLFQLRIKTKSTQNVTQRKKKNDRFQRNSNSRSVQMLKTFQTNPFNYSTFIRQVMGFLLVAWACTRCTTLRDQRIDWPLSGPAIVKGSMARSETFS